MTLWNLYSELLKKTWQRSGTVSESLVVSLDGYLFCAVIYGWQSLLLSLLFDNSEHLQVHNSWAYYVYKRYLCYSICLYYIPNNVLLKIQAVSSSGIQTQQIAFSISPQCDFPSPYYACLKNFNNMPKICLTTLSTKEDKRVDTSN